MARFQIVDLLSERMELSVARSGMKGVPLSRQAVGKTPTTTHVDDDCSRGFYLRAVLGALPRVGRPKITTETGVTHGSRDPPSPPPFA